MEIRKARIQDVARLIQLWEGYESYHRDSINEEYMKRFLQKNSNAIPEMEKYFKKKISSGDSDIFVAEDLAKLVGFIMISTYDSPPINEVKKYGHIGYFFVEQDVRGKGVGKKLYKEVLEWVKNKKVKRISLEANFHNSKTIEFYKKLGFREFEVSMINDLA